MLPARARADNPGAMQQFIVTIEGHGFTDVEAIELLALPADGDPVETKYGTCIVTATELVEHEHYEGKIACRLP
jgi:hypothetical protein